jgi:hypothetical protein
LRRLCEGRGVRSSLAAPFTRYLCAGDLRGVLSSRCCSQFEFNLKAANLRVMCTSETHRAEPSHEGGIAGCPI